MSEQIILDNEWVTVRFHTKDKIIHHTFHQHFEGDMLRRALNAGTEALKKNGATKWLSDDRNYGELSHDDVMFGLQDWGPRTAAAGWKFWALVVPESMAGRASMQAVVQAYWEMGVRVAIFTNVEDARAWLAKQ
ncbi:MAG: STAS/SEC14 domain-containing protein [bacterium]|nr:STAS/SEC14 domain-containing protein [bacterium]